MLRSHDCMCNTLTCAERRIEQKRRLCDCYSRVYVYVFFPSAYTFVLASICASVCKKLALLCIGVCVCLSMSLHAVFPVTPRCVCVIMQRGCSNGSCD